MRAAFKPWAKGSSAVIAMATIELPFISWASIFCGWGGYERNARHRFVFFSTTVHSVDLCFAAAAWCVG